MSLNNFNIEKLSGRDNYSSWAFSMQNYLQHEELWDEIIVDIPARGLDSKRNTKALTKINMCLDPKLFNHVRGITKAADAWNTIKKLFQDDGLDRRVGLVVQLVNTKLKNFANSEDYVNSVMTLCHKLNDAGLTVTDEWVGIFMLAGLPSEYKPMILGMESSGKAISADAVKAKLLQDVAIVEEVEDELALFIKPQKKKVWKKKSTQNSHRNTENNVATQHTQEEKVLHMSMFSTLATTKHESNDWYIDSGATRHMSNNLKNFSKIEKCIDSIETAGPNSVKVQGRGVVNIFSKTQRNENIALEMKNTLYVPNLTANLLSVKQMTARGLKVSFSRNKCFIIKDNTVIIEANLCKEGLYKLKTVQNPTNVQTQRTMKHGTITIDERTCLLAKKNLSKQLFERNKRMLPKYNIHQESTQKLQYSDLVKCWLDQERGHTNNVSNNKPSNFPRKANRVQRCRTL